MDGTAIFCQLQIPYTWISYDEKFQWKNFINQMSPMDSFVF